MKPKIITKIEPQKKNPKRRSIFIDGEFIFGVDEEVVSKLGLEKGDTITEKGITEILVRKSENEAKEAALRFLSFRRRTEKEIKDKLRQKGFDDRTIKSTIEKLKSYDLVNDYEFAVAWIKERMAHRPRGKRLLRQELWKKGIQKEIIDRAIDELCRNEDESALEVLKKVEKRYRKLESKVARRRMLGLLIRRGFSYETANQTLHDFPTNED